MSAEEEEESRILAVRIGVVNEILSQTVLGTIKWRQTPQSMGHSRRVQFEASISGYRSLFSCGAAEPDCELLEIGGVPLLWPGLTGAIRREYAVDPLLLLRDLLLKGAEEGRSYQCLSLGDFLEELKGGALLEQEP